MLINFFKNIVFVVVFLLFSVMGMEQQQFKDNEFKSLQKAFNGIEPFYGIAVTRESGNDYVPLSEEESYFVFCILNHIFGNTVEESKFIQDINNIFIDKAKRFNSLVENELKRRDQEKNTEQANKIIENRLLSEIIDKLNKKLIFKNNNIETKKVDALSVHIMPLINNEEEASKKIIELVVPANLSTDKTQAASIILTELKKVRENKQQRIAQIVLESFSESENYFVTNIKKKLSHNKDLEKFCEEQKHTLIECYREFMKQFEAFPQELKALEESWSLVVFNEMFFSKTMPLCAEDINYIMFDLELFLKINNQAIVNTNFLMEHKEKFTSIDKRNQWLNAEHELYKKLEQNNINNFFHSAYSNIQWQNLFSNIKDSEQIEINMLQNTSFTSWNGEPLIFYKKTSYRDEAETSLKKNGYIYSIGLANDLPGVVENVHQSIQQVLLGNISTEICYDLEIGIRNKFKTYPKTHKIHIFQSNTLPINSKNIDNLPDNGSIIFHVDPEYTEVLVKNNFLCNLNKKEDSELFNKYKIGKFERRNPFFSMKILLNDNLFTFSCWNFQELLQRAANR